MSCLALNYPVNVMVNVTYGTLVVGKLNITRHFVVYKLQLIMKKNNQKELRYFTTQAGKIPFLDWLNGLKDPVIRLRIRRRLDRIEIGNFGDCEPVGEGVSELRLFFGPGYRIYFAEYDDEIIILLCGGDKSSQKKDIKTAKMYWHELKEQSDE